VEDWRTYDGVAATYERIHAQRVMEPARDLVALADPPNGGRVLDVGTGTGVAAEAARERINPGGLVVGADISLPMLEQGRRARPSVRLVVAEVIDLPFPDGAFDAVVGNFVVTHFTKYETALFDMIRVLRPGGRLALSAWADGVDDLTKTWLEIVESVVGPGMLQDVRSQAAPWAERFRDRSFIEEVLLGAGLKHVRTEQREYRFQYALDEYVEGLQTWTSGRFVRSMLGEGGWERLHAQAREVFADRFSDPVNDFRDVWLAVGTKT
jgi:ubiquinone/menaquinone biosynthesis C-methylase UbiE